MNSIYLVGDNSNERNPFNQPWRTGSTRMHNRRLQILVNEKASYCRGSGLLWATEGEVVCLTLKSGGPYIKGVCTKIHASSLAIEFAIYESPYTWGQYINGQVVILSIFDINRYDCYAVDQFSPKHLAAPAPIHALRIHRRMMLSLDKELQDQFEEEVSPALGRALINCSHSLKQYSERYIGNESHSGHEHSTHAKRTFHKFMRQLIQLLEKDGLNKYQSPGCKKKIAPNTVNY